MPACPICKSRRWYPDGLGGQYCQYGHQRENFQVQEGEDAITGNLRIRSGRPKNKSKEINDEKLYAYQTRRGMEKVFMTASQYVLRRLIYTLIHEMGFPAQFEQVVQHLWILYLTKFRTNEMFGKEPTEPPEIRVESSKENDDYDEYDDIVEGLLDDLENTEDDENPREIINNEFGDTTTVKKENTIIEFTNISDILSIFRTVYLLNILHLGCIWMRLPILMGDIHRWVNSCQLPFLEIHHEFSNELKLHLGNVIRRFKIDQLDSVYSLIKTEGIFIRFYKDYYGVVFPEINAPPVLYRFIRDLILPVETYIIAKELLQLINLKLDWDQYTYYHPDNLLLGVVIVVIKLIYGLDYHRRVPGDKDVFVLYFPKFEDWVKKLSDRHNKLFQQEIPWDFTDLKEWVDINPDKYIEYCADLLVGNDTTNDNESSKPEKKYEDMKQLSKPFRELSETVVSEEENRAYEHEIGKLQNLIQLGDSDLSNELTIQEFYKILKERNAVRKRIESLENHKQYIEPIEKEIQELSFCVETPEKQVLHVEDSKNDLRSRYSTFLYTPDEYDNEDKPKMKLGEKYTSYQLEKDVFRRKREDIGFVRHPELIGAYHEDYERILMFASSLIGEKIDKVQEAVRKIELDLYVSIEKESL